ncbi:peptidoglycan-binding protein [Saccharothrix deserti]|uniref:peptidoglycan-binding protein n=1 Tax=Saccharothrix deserti TaxID=2593674 RepID=UPI00131DA1F8|nr:peptidoglycan-binding protein [Saccharothrix deserti]
MTNQLRAGVGDNRPNHPEDVALVQLFLNGNPNAKIAVDGRFGPATRAAVEKFQKAQFGFGDGIVDPGDITFHRLRGNGEVEFRTSALLRAFAVHKSESTEPDSGTLSDERFTADRQGAVFRWISPNGVAHIYTHPVLGTWEVRGLILVRYQELGEESSGLGLPISGERGAPPGRVSWFEHGHIAFSTADGTVRETILP